MVIYGLRGIFPIHREFVIINELNAIHQTKTSIVIRKILMIDYGDNNILYGVKHTNVSNV